MVWVLLLVQDSFRFLYREFGARFTPIWSRRPLFQKLIFLFPISADGRRGLFPLWDSSQSFGFYLLPSPVRRFVRTTICPCTPFFTHPVTECKHLLVSILTWICYLRNWPRFFFQWSVLGLLIQTQRNSRNSLFLFSQWETTWHSVLYWYGSRIDREIKGKELHPLLDLGVLTIEKGAILLPLMTVGQLTYFYILCSKLLLKMKNKFAEIFSEHTLQRLSNCLPKVITHCIYLIYIYIYIYIYVCGCICIVYLESNPYLKLLLLKMTD